jgi:hypothetical protein
MAILGEDKQQQVLVLGRLGWPLRRIEAATGVRCETTSAYLKAAGIGLKGPWADSSKPASRGYPIGGKGDAQGLELAAHGVATGPAS